jgi:hypothetical protein
MDATFRTVAVAATLFLLLSVLGCATPQGPTEPLSASQRTEIRGVSIAKSIAAPDYPQVVGPSASTAGFLVGPLGLMASMHSENPDSQALKKVFSEHRIDIKDIVRQEFAAELAGRHLTRLRTRAATRYSSSQSKGMVSGQRSACDPSTRH